MTLFIGRSDLRRTWLIAERSAADPAESESRRAGKSTLRTTVLEGAATLSAKLHLLRIVKTTACATHACFPLGTITASLIEARLKSRRTESVSMVWPLSLWMEPSGIGMNGEQEVPAHH